MAGLHFDITGNNTDLLRKLEETRQGISQTSKRIESEGGSIEAYFNKMAKGAAAIGLGFSATQLIKDIVQVRGEFQQLEIAFETMLKSKDKASALMGQLTETAAKTPFDLQGVAQGAKQLLAYGTASEEVNDTLIRLGNIASGLSIPLGDLVYLYGTTQTQGRLFTQDVRQFMGRGIPLVKELAAELGKTEQQINEMVTEGKIGFPEVEKVIRNMTNESGQFYNLMEKQSASLTGQISNLGDAWDMMLNKLGTETQGIASAGISAATSLVENYEEVGVVLASLVASYGTYKAAIIIVNTLEKANIMLLRKAVIEKRAAAAANITLSNSMAVAAARGKLFALVQRNIVSSFKGIGKTLANPYVLLGAAVGAATYGLYKFYTRETEVERMQRQYNETKEAAVRHENEHKAKVDELISSLENEATAQLERVGAIETLKQLYPGIIEKYIDEEGHLKNLIALKKELAEFDATKKVEQNKTDLHSYDERIKNQEEYINRMRTNDQSAFDDEIAKLEELKRQREITRGKVASDYINNSINSSKSMSDDELKRTITTYQKALSENTNGEWFDSNQEFKVDEINRYITALKDLQTARANAIKNKEYWENEKKNAESQLAALSDVEAAGKKGAALKAKIKEYKEKINAFSTNTSKEENQADKFRKEQEKYKLLLSKQELDQIRANEDLQMQVDEARIKAMDEGSKKTIAEMELNFDKEMQAIDRQKEDALRKKIENARSAWEANPENKKKSFDATGIELTDDERKKFDELYKAVIANNEKTYSDLANQYLSYTDQRLEIEKKFNDDIVVLQEARKKAVEKGDTDEVAKVDRSIAKATADKGKELMRHDFDVLKQSPEYIRAFEDLRKTSSETLNSLLEQLENAKQTAAQTLNPEDLREYTTTIQEIMDELDARNPFQALADRQRELAEAEKELADAKQQLDAVKRGGKIVTGIRSTSLGEDGKIKVENTYLTAAEALKKYNEAKDKHQQANNNFIKAEKTAREKVDELAGAIQAVGNAIGGQAGEIISLMGDVALFATGTIDGISKVAQTGANAISAVEKASVILGIISTAIQLLQKISELGNNKAFKQYEAYAEKVKEINALTDAVNEYRIAALEARQAEENWFSEDNLRNLRDYKKVHDEVAKAYADKAMESQAIYKNQSGGGWLTGAFNWVMGNLSALSWWDKWKNIWGQGDYDKGQTAAINNLRIETRKKSSGFLGTGIGGKSQKTEDLVTWARNQGLGELFDDEGLLNKELAQSLIDNYGGKLVGQTKETLESLIKLREQYDEYIEQLHEYVSSLYEPLVDNFVDSLWDWFDNGKDALDSFKDYASDTFRDIVSDMMRTIVLDKVVGNFSDDIASLYEEYAKGSIDEAELMKKVADRTSGLVDNYEQNIPTLQNILGKVDDYLKNAGIDLKKSESTSQSATSKGFQSMSQDSADELNGRFTALQMTGEEIKNQAIMQTSILQMIYGLVSGITIPEPINGNTGDKVVPILSGTDSSSSSSGDSIVSTQLIALNQITNSLLGVNQAGFDSLLFQAVQTNNYLDDIAGFQKKIVGLLNDIDSRIMRGVKVI